MYYIFNKSNGESAVCDSASRVIATLDYFINELCEKPEDLMLIHGHEVVLEINKTVRVLDRTIAYNPQYEEE
jgi:hypothetical protein